jgi:hypothetical protein
MKTSRNSRCPEGGCAIKACQGTDSDGRRPERRAGSLWGITVAGGLTVGMRDYGLRGECGGKNRARYKGVTGHSPVPSLTGAPPRASRAPQTNQRVGPPPRGAKDPRGDNMRRHTGWGNRDAPGGTVDTDGLRPIDNKHAVKSRMHPESTRKASGFLTAGFPLKAIRPWLPPGRWVGNWSGKRRNDGTASVTAFGRLSGATCGVRFLSPRRRHALHVVGVHRVAGGYSSDSMNPCNSTDTASAFVFPLLLAR